MSTDMNPVQRSLMYDAVVIAIALLVVTLSGGTTRGFALLVVGVTVLKAPYDVWEAKHGRLG